MNNLVKALANKTILLTGGTGSFGRAFCSHLLSNNFKGVIRIYSRDEFKQHEMSKTFNEDVRLRFLIGDVKDVQRLHRAMDGVAIVVHAAALKHVPILEYNPFEAVKTNILGSQNVIDSAIDLKVSKVILISSDKAVSPVNLYGATKMVAEKIFVQANSYTGGIKTIFSVARYGNVAGSRGSVVSVFQNQVEDNHLTITDERMTRFWITLEEGVKFVLMCIDRMKGGEIFVPKTPSIKIIDLAHAIAPDAKIKIIGIRPGEKIHETLISEDEARHTRDFGKYFVVEPEFAWWKSPTKHKVKRLASEFLYSSNNNKWWLTVGDINKLLKLSESMAATEA